MADFAVNGSMAWHGTACHGSEMDSIHVKRRIPNRVIDHFDSIPFSTVFGLAVSRTLGVFLFLISFVNIPTSLLPLNRHPRLVIVRRELFVQ